MTPPPSFTYTKHTHIHSDSVGIIVLCAHWCEDTVSKGGDREGFKSGTSQTSETPHPKGSKAAKHRRLCPGSAGLCVRGLKADLCVGESGHVFMFFFLLEDPAFSHSSCPVQ